MHVVDEFRLLADHSLSHQKGPNARQTQRESPGARAAATRPNHYSKISFERKKILLSVGQREPLNQNIGRYKATSGPRRWPSQILWLKAGLLGDFREDCWAEFLGVVKREWVIRPSVLFHDLVGANCAVVAPPDPLQRGEDATRLRRRPGAHAAMSKMVFAESGGSSPWAIRSRTISCAADRAR